MMLGFPMRILTMAGKIEIVSEKDRKPNKEDHPDLFYSEVFFYAFTMAVLALSIGAIFLFFK